jgi:hypothetical protein
MEVVRGPLRAAGIGVPLRSSIFFKNVGLFGGALLVPSERRCRRPVALRGSP